MPVRFEPNNPFPRELDVQVGKKTTASRSLLGTIGDVGWKWATKPTIIMGGWNINPLSPSSKGPAEPLRRIAALADQGLDRLAPFEQITGHYHKELDRIFQSDKAGGTHTKAANQTIGPVAVIPTLPIDPDVTKAIPLQARIPATRWEDEMVEHREDLACKLSAFSAVLQMRNIAGVPNKDNLHLMKIVEKATKKGSTETLWEVFVNHKNDQGKLVYDLSFFQKIKAGWFYWTCYQTSLIDNTVGAYLKSFIENATKGLISPDNKKPRLKLIRAFLEEANEFLTEDMGATKAFAYAIEPDGGVDKYRDRTIKRHYGKLEDLCKAFSETRVQKDSPPVPFFEKFHTIPVIGLFFKAFEWIVNRFIIQRAMQNSILPPTLKSAVENSLEATEPHNLPFALGLTRFFNRQIENLRINLENNSTTPIPPELPGTEIVSPLIKNLIRFLELEPLKTQPELKQKFQEIENGKRFTDQTIEDYIQAGLKDSCRYLFDQVNKTVESGELFANLLQLSCTAFSVPVKDHDAQMAEFREEELKLKQSAGELFTKIIHQAVVEKISGSKPEATKEIAKKAFEDGQTVAKIVFDGVKEKNGETKLPGLIELCEKMTEKIDRSAQAPTSENNIQPDIASFLQIMKVYGNRKKIQERINNLKEKNDRDAIWRLVTPLYERAGKLVERILHLQELQDEYPAHTDVANHFKFTKELLQSIHSRFREEPRYLNHFIRILEERCEKIGESLGKKAPLPLLFKGYIQSISVLSKSMANEQQVIEAIHAIYPPREDGQVVEKEGLLEQLLQYQRGVHPPTFIPRACLKEIAKNLDFFPAEEQRQLRKLIGNGSDLAGKWAELSALLQGIYERHQEIKDRGAAELEEVLRIASQETEDKIEKYTRLKDDNHTSMQKEMRDISQEVLNLRNDTHRAKLDLPFYLSSKATRALITAGCAGLGGGLTAFCGWAFGPAAAAFSAGASSAFYVGTQNLSSLDDRNPRAIAKTVGSLVAGTAAAYTGGAVASYIGGTTIFNAVKTATSYLIPSAVTTLGSYFVPGAQTLIGGGAGALTGFHVEQAVHTTTQDKAFPRVMEIFIRAYEAATRSPRIVHAFLTRAMIALSS